MEEKPKQICKAVKKVEFVLYKYCAKKKYAGTFSFSCVLCKQ